MKIFILEDSKTQQSLYEFFLKEHDIDLFTTFDDALLGLKEKKYDLYILDIKLNNLYKKNGLDILDAIPDKRKVIIISGVDARSYLKEHLIDVDFYLKPISISVLKSNIYEKQQKYMV